MAWCMWVLLGTLPIDNNCSESRFSLRFNWKSFSILIKTFSLMQNALQIKHNVQHLHHNKRQQQHNSNNNWANSNTNNNNEATAKVFTGQQQSCQKLNSNSNKPSISLSLTVSLSLSLSDILFPFLSSFVSVQLWSSI